MKKPPERRYGVQKRVDFFVPCWLVFFHLPTGSLIFELRRFYERIEHTCTYCYIVHDTFDLCVPLFDFRASIISISISFHIWLINVLDRAKMIGNLYLVWLSSITNMWISLVELFSLVPCKKFLTCLN